MYFWPTFYFLIHNFFIEVTLLYDSICFTCTTLYFCFCIPYSVFTTKNLVSMCHHTVDPLYLFFPPPHPLCSGNHHSVFCIYVFLFIWLGLFIYLFFCLLVCWFFHIAHMTDIIQYLSFSIWLISLSIIPQVPSMLQMARLHCIDVCIYVYIPHPLYPFICWWALRLFPYLGYCK